MGRGIHCWALVAVLAPCLSNAIRGDPAILREGAFLSVRGEENATDPAGHGPVVSGAEEASAKAACRKHRAQQECLAEMEPKRWRCDWKEVGPKHFICIANTKVAEELHANAACVGRPYDFCENHKVAGLEDTWRCQWKNDACIADGSCGDWQVKTPFHENLGVMWVLSLVGTLECLEKWGGGCSLGTGVHCFMAFLLMTCCCCCCCYPCWDVIEEAEIDWDQQRRKCMDMPCCQPRAPNADRSADSGPQPDEIHDCVSSDLWHELGSFVLTAQVVGLLVKVKWKDQGHGEQKGHIRTTLSRGPEVLCTEDTFGACARGEAAQGERGYLSAERCFESGSRICDLAQQGDTIKFEYTVGGGRGGQQLHINYFEALPNFGEGYKSVDES